MRTFSQTTLTTSAYALRRGLIISRVSYYISYCYVQTPFAKQRGQVTQSYTQTYHKRLLTTLTSVLGRGCLHTAIWSRILSFPPLCQVQRSMWSALHKGYHKPVQVHDTVFQPLSLLIRPLPCCKYKRVVICQTFVVSLCARLHNLTSVLGKGCLHTAIYRKQDTLFPSSYILLIILTMASIIIIIVGTTSCYININGVYM